MHLTPAQIRDRGRLAERFRVAIEAALWEAIESCPQELLCSDGGEPYGGSPFGPGTSSLSVMVERSADAAHRVLKLWL
jgi:hypothetical protein